MKNFDEAVKDYLVKRVDKTNPHLVSYEIAYQTHIRVINKNRRLPKRQINSRQVLTPLGVFDSLALAAQAHNVTKQTMSNWLGKNKEGFKEIKNEQKNSPGTDQQ